MRLLPLVVSAAGLIFIGILLGRWSASGSENFSEGREPEFSTRTMYSVPKGPVEGNAGNEVRANSERSAVFRSFESLEERLRKLTVPYSTPDPVEIGRTLLEVEEHLSRLSENEITVLIKSWVDSGTTREIADIVYARYAELSPHRAGEALLGQYRETGKLHGAAGFLKKFVSRDYRAAESWVDTNSTEETRDEFLVALLIPLAEVEPEIAAGRLTEVQASRDLSGVAAAIVANLEIADLLDLADHLSVPGKTGWGENPHLQAVLRSWTQKDSPSLATWILNQPDENLGRQAVSSIMVSMRMDDIPAMVEAVESKLGSSEAAAELAGEVWIRWLSSETGREEAIDWFVENGHYFAKPSGGRPLMSMAF